MSERVTGTKLAERWVWQYPDGQLDNTLYELVEEAVSVNECMHGDAVRVAIVELDETPASPPWPPTWGEGPTSGWCRRKADGHGPLRWEWSRRHELYVDGIEHEVDGSVTDQGLWRSPAEFAADFEPL